MSNVPNELPEGWTDTTLSEVVACSAEKVEPGEDDESPYLSLEHIESNSCRILGHGRGSDVKSTKNVFRAGDVLYGKLRPYLNKVCRPDFDGMCSTDILVLRPSEALDPGFMFRILTGTHFVAHAIANSNGINLPRTSFTALGEYELGLPPLAEQRRIVAKIEALQARSRKAREALEAIPPLLEQFRQSVLAAAFRGDLTANWREQHSDVEPASVLLERIRTERRRKWEQAELAKFKAKGKVPKDDSWKEKYVEPEPVDDDDLPELPEGWCWATIDQIGFLKSGKRLPKGSSLVTENTGYPYIRAGNLKDGTVKGTILYLVEADYKRVSQYKIYEGDLYLTIVGASIGDTGVCPKEHSGANLTENAARVQLVSATLPTCMGFVIRAPQFDSQIQQRVLSAAQGKLALQRIKRLCVPLCSVEEQTVIANRITEHLARIEAMKGVMELIDAESSSLDQSILAKAFRGELVPQDPNDEPASLILERIQAERAAESSTKPSRRSSKPKRQRGTNAK